MRERVSPSSAMLERIDAQYCRLRLGANSLEGLAIWIASLGYEFQVEGPPELAAQIRDVGERLLRGGAPASTH